MIRKIINYIKNDLKKNYKFYIVLVILAILFSIPFDYYIYSPGGLVDLTDRIDVENAYNSKGSFNLTYVMARPANIPTILLSYIIPYWDIVDIDDMRIDEESKNEIENRDKILLKETSYDAIIAAFSEAGKEYSIDSIKLTVTHVYSDANTNLEVGDVIISINNVKIDDYQSFKNELLKYKENDKISLKVLRNNKLFDCYSVLFNEDGQVLIGISLSELKDINTSIKVDYVFKDNESGSSRGLLCALDIYNKITDYDLSKGKKIAGTGVIYENGEVGEIDGVKYKLRGAVNNKADVFIVPTANYKEAIYEKSINNYNIIIIEADNLHNVILKLKEL